MFDTKFVFLLIALFLASIGSVLLAGMILVLPKNSLEKVSNYLMYIAGGSLLGVTFMGVLPEAIEQMPYKQVFLYVLGGIIVFFIIEKIILWRICVDQKCERHMHAAAPMITIGDAFHNAVDGVAIASSFSISVEFGILATISIMMHEVPQELGDFGVLIRSGWPKRKALFYNVLSSVSAIVVGVIAYFSMTLIKNLIPISLAFSAASFLYIALADLIPEMHRETKIKNSAIQLVFVLIGILLIFVFEHHH